MYRAASFYRHTAQRVNAATDPFVRRQVRLSTLPILPRPHTRNTHLGTAPLVSRVSSVAVQPTPHLRTKAVQDTRTATRKYTSTTTAESSILVEEEVCHLDLHTALTSFVPRSSNTLLLVPVVCNSFLYNMAYSTLTTPIHSEWDGGIFVIRL